MNEEIKTNENVEQKEAATPEIVESTPVEEKPVENPAYFTQLEDARKDLYGAYNRQRKFSNFLMIGILVAAVGSMFLITSTETVLVVLGWVLVGLAVVGMIVYYILTKNKLPDKTKQYIKDVTTIVNNANFDNEKYSLNEQDANEKFELVELASDKVYDNLVDIGSRNILHGAYNNKEFKYGEVALHIPASGKKGREPIFIGKYVSLTNEMHFENRYIFVKKGEKDSDLPNTISDLVLLSTCDDPYIVYGPEGTNYKDIFPQEFIEEFEHLDVSNHVLNVNIVVWASHSAAYVSYDDSIMQLPFEKPFDVSANEQSRDFQDKIFAMLDLLNK